MRVRLGFQQGEDERFIVTASVHPTSSLASASFTSQTLYDHEDSFLARLIAADLEEGPTQQLAIAAIVSVARPEAACSPVEVDLTPGQAALLGLNLRNVPAPAHPASRAVPPSETYPFSFHASPEVFHDFLMNAPTPFVMVTGPEHIFTFINPPYVRIIGRTSRDQVIGRPIREALPELCGQPCLAILENAYKTGLPQVRKELLTCFHQQDTGLMEEVYFDILYQPMRDRFGSVTGIMAQATDVTERVLARQVSEHREQKLYRLWAELEAIYHLAPVGLAVIDAAAWKLLRLNRLQARFLGGTLESLTGAPLAEASTIPAEVMHLLRQAADGTAVKNVQVQGQPNSSEAQPQRWNVSVRPTLNEAGTVETLILIALPISRMDVQDDTLRQAFFPVSH